jgi:hypothetical protein
MDLREQIMTGARHVVRAKTCEVELVTDDLPYGVKDRVLVGAVAHDDEHKWSAACQLVQRVANVIHDDGPVAQQSATSTTKMREALNGRITCDRRTLIAEFAR